MVVATPETYIQRLKEQKPLIYMGGEEIKNIVDNPIFRVGINAIATTYEASTKPECQNLAVLDSPLINEKISRWTHIQQSMDDAILKMRLMRKLGSLFPGCACNYRCITTDCLNAAWVISYEIDKKYHTNYHERVVEIVKHVQKNDLVVGGSIVDPKGDRSLPPSKQPDPDVYLHVVEKGEDGIVVRGAKAHSTAAPYTNMLCVFPCRAMREDEKDYAVAFFTPVDAKGITYICRQSSAPTEPKEVEAPISSRYGHVEAFVVYDDVFVPWKNVFMCGEYEFAGPMMNTFASFHLWHKCGCRTNSIDLTIGAAALIADYNGVERASHIRNYLTEMIINAEIVYSCGIAAAVNGLKHESGVYIPNPLQANVGKYYASKKLGENRFYLQDTAGGLVRTMATEKDYQNPPTRRWMEKYLKGKVDIPVEHRIRAFKLVEDLTASDYAGWYHAMCISGGGGPQLLKGMILATYNLERSKKMAKVAAKIEKS